MIDQAALLDRLRRRDPAAFTELFDAYSDRVYRLAAGLLNDEDEAEGVVQESFLRLFERLDQFEGRAKLSTWLYRIAFNLCQDQLRRRRPTMALADELDDEAAAQAPVILTDWRLAPDRLLDSAEITAELDRAISTLPPKLRAIFILREIEGLSTEESAQVLGITAGAAKVRLHRARLWLREQLAAYFAELAE